MPSRSRKRKTEPAPVPAAVPAQSIWERGLSTHVICLLIALAVLLFYWTPLFDSNTSIQWDAVDVHYSCQKYFADQLRAGHMPFWTPYVFSGMPFLADPQVGAWYPLNWPFIVLGITPRAIEQETALHCLLAALGMFLLAKDLLRSRWAAVFAAAFYAFSGFFAAHTSHTGMFQAAAIFPWLLWTGLRAARSSPWLPALATATGTIILTGHFQTALYGLCALALFLAIDFVVERKPVRNLVMVAVCVAIAGAALPAIMTLPGLELTRESIRAQANYSQNADAVLVPGALLTLINPDHYNAPEAEPYTGPQDVTQFYYYEGILCIPLALAGLSLARVRWFALGLIVPAAWYAFGPSGFLYSLVAQLPGLRSVRSPVNAWFIVAMGLAMLAASGLLVLLKRFPARWIPIAMLAFLFLDLRFWNMSHNRLTYARSDFESLYGSLERRFQSLVIDSGGLQPMARVWAATDTPAFGPLNGALDTRIESTYGYNPLELARYARYMDAANANPRLLDALSVTSKLDPRKGFVSNTTAAPRISVPAYVSAAGQLEVLDSPKQALVEGASLSGANGPADVRLTSYEGDGYRARYHADRATLVRLAVPYFPGWRAEIDGRPENVGIVDEALMGVVVPAGDHDLVFRYRSNWFATGAAISAIAWIATFLWLGLSLRQVKARPG